MAMAVLCETRAHGSVNWAEWESHKSDDSTLTAEGSGAVLARIWVRSGADPFVWDQQPKYTHLRAHSEWQRELAINSFFFRSLLRSLYVCVKGDVKWGEFIFHFEFHFLKNSFSVSHSRGNKHLHFKVLLVKINEKQTFLWSLESALEKLRVEINMFYSS